MRANNAPTVSTFIAKEDTYITQKSPSTNFSTNNMLIIQNKSLYQAKTLVRYTVSGLPKGAIINSAFLNLYVSNGNKINGSLDTGGFVSSVNGVWASNTVTWSNAPAEGIKINNLEPHANGVPGEWRTADVSQVHKRSATLE